MLKPCVERGSFRTGAEALCSPPCWDDEPRRGEYKSHPRVPGVSLAQPVSGSSECPRLSAAPACGMFVCEEHSASVTATVGDGLAGSSLRTPTVTGSASPPPLSSSSSFFRFSFSFSSSEITASFCAHSALYLERCSASSPSAARRCS